MRASASTTPGPPFCDDDDDGYDDGELRSDEDDSHPFIAPPFGRPVPELALQYPLELPVLSPEMLV